MRNYPGVIHDSESSWNLGLSTLTSCHRFVLGNSTMTGMNLLLELYILGRLLLSIRSRARVDPITAVCMPPSLGSMY